MSYIYHNYYFYNLLGILKMNKLKIGFIILLIPLFAFTAHKYYISSTKIEYKKESKTIQITMRFFIDDLQETINRTYSESVELALPNETAKIDSFISNYISKKLEVIINSNKKTYSFLGKEYNNDEIYIYLEIENVEFINKIEVKNSMLMEIFPEQQNIIKLYLNDAKKTFLLTKQKDKDLLKF